MKQATKRTNAIKLTTYLKRYGWQCFFYVFLTVLETALDALVPIMSAQVLAYITDAEYTKAIWIFVYIIIEIIINNMLGFIKSHLYNKYSLKIIKDLNIDCAKQIFKLNTETYSNHSSGEIIRRAVSDPGRIVDYLANIISVLSSITSFTVVLIYVIFLNWITGLCLIAIVAIGLIIDTVRINKWKKFRKISFKLNDKYFSLANEAVKSERDIKVSGIENQFLSALETGIDNCFEIDLKRGKINTNYLYARSMFLQVASFSLLILGIVLLQQGLIAVSVFMLIYSYRSSMGQYVRNVSSLMNYVTEIKISLGRINDLFDEDEYVVEKFGTKSIENVVGNVEFKDVCFTYKEYKYEREEKSRKMTKTLKSAQQVLNKINFTVDANTTVAFVGKSGSGKSTICNLFSGLIHTDEGQVLLDGVDIKDLDKATLRKSISLVNQFPYIFDMSIKENLKLSKQDATDEELWEVLNKAYLGEFVNTLADKMDTIVGESGIKLSGGQRQRLAIARVLLRQTPIIIFDESTSSLDNFAQQHIKDCIDNLKGSSTIVIVAHRLSTIRNVDKIFFLDEGKIVDSGTFDDLFEHNEEFKNMFMVETFEDKLEQKKEKI